MTEFKGENELDSPDNLSNLSLNFSAIENDDDHVFCDVIEAKSENQYLHQPLVAHKLATTSKFEQDAAIAAQQHSKINFYSEQYISEMTPQTGLTAGGALPSSALRICETSNFNHFETIREQFQPVDIFPVVGARAGAIEGLP